jgi:hippurate hydrolase
MILDQSAFSNRKGHYRMRRKAYVSAWWILAVTGCAGTPAVRDPGTPLAIEVTSRSDLHETITAQTDRDLADLAALYKDVHSHPELSLQEQNTAAQLAGRFRSAGYTVTENVGGHGLVAILANGPGPTVLVRADMDALPVTEITDLPYASKVVVTHPDGTQTGVMHACGHDVHVACLAGFARIVSDIKSEWSGTLVLIAQPAEEIGLGAMAMIKDGLFDQFPKPDYCIALHVDAQLPAGSIGYTAGWCNANVDSVDITIHGKGGHGAAPHLTVDPIVTAAHLITTLQTIVSRRIDPVEDGVVTVGSIHGGTKHNIIADEVKLQLTVRSYKDEVRKTMLDSITQITQDVCKTMGCPQPPEVVINGRDLYTPAAYNDPKLVAKGIEVIGDLIGRDQIYELPQTMGGEDFGRYAKTLNVPGFMFRLGSISRQKIDAFAKAGNPLPGLHSARFAPDPEPTIRTGVRAMTVLALSLLDAKPSE